MTRMARRTSPPARMNPPRMAPMGGVDCIEVRGRGLMTGLEIGGPVARQALAIARDRHGQLVRCASSPRRRSRPPKWTRPSPRRSARTGMSLCQDAD